jgi:hypothetical protein
METQNSSNVFWPEQCYIDRIKIDLGRRRAEATGPSACECEVRNCDAIRLLLCQIDHWRKVRSLPPGGRRLQGGNYTRVDRAFTDRCCEGSIIYQL